jgi:hypothetical protein
VASPEGLARRKKELKLQNCGNIEKRAKIKFWDKKTRDEWQRMKHDNETKE